MSRWSKAKLVTGSDANLLLHDVDAGDEFGHRMLDLNPRVHLDEEELVVLVQEFERARAAVTYLAARIGAALADARQRAERNPGAGASSIISDGAAASSSRARTGRPRYGAPSSTESRCAAA